MTPAKLLIAQRLAEAAHELRAIVALMDEYKSDSLWHEVAGELLNASDTQAWFATKIRAEE